MTLSIRLDRDTEDELRRRLTAQGIPISRFVREAICEKLARGAPPDTPYDLGKPIFGRFQSGETDRSVRRKEMIRERLHDRYRR